MHKMFDEIFEVKKGNNCFKNCLIIKLQGSVILYKIICKHAKYQEITD